MSTPVYTINILPIAHMRTTGLPVDRDAWTFSFLISGENIPLMLVDTGIKESMPNEIMKDSGLFILDDPECTYDAQLAKFGYTRDDVKIILHTHIHEDHAGNDDYFPQAKIIMTRKEMMWSVADMFDSQYPAEYVKYFVDQLHVPGKMRLIDDIAEIAPGIVLEPIEGHSWGSMLIKVNTKSGLAIMCGDIMYNMRRQCIENAEFPDIAAHYNSCIDSFGDGVTANTWNKWADKKAIQKVWREAKIILPSHDNAIRELYGDTI